MLHVSLRCACRKWAPLILCVLLFLACESADDDDAGADDDDDLSLDDDNNDDNNDNNDNDDDESPSPYTRTTIRAIQSGVYIPGTLVEVHGVVTTSRRMPADGAFFVSETRGGDWSGIRVRVENETGGVFGIDSGSLLDIRGRYDEEDEVSTIVVEDFVGLDLRYEWPPPNPTVVDPLDVMTGGPLAEDYESVLVMVADTGVTELDPGGTFFVVGGALPAHDDLYHADLFVGDELRSLTGILHRPGNESTLLPRHWFDVDQVDPPGLSNWSSDAVGSGELPALAVEPDGVAHVVYQHANVVYYAHNRDGYWDRTPIAYDATYLAPLSIAVDSEGWAHILYWTDWELMYLTNRSGFGVAMEVDEATGSEFGTAIQLTAADEPRIAYAGADYYDDDSMDEQRESWDRLTYGEFHEPTWTLEPIDLDEVYGWWGVLLSLVLDSQGRPTLFSGSYVIPVGEDGDLYRMELTAGDWSVTWVDGCGGVPTMAVDPVGVIHTYHGYPGRCHGRFRHNYRDGAQWFADAIDASGYASQLAIDAAAAHYLAFAGYFDRLVRCAVKQGETWRHGVVTAEQGTPAGIQVDAAGVVHVLLRIDETGQIIHATLPPVK